MASQPYPQPAPYQRSPQPTGAHTLIIRQQPERGKVVARGKEKDRKPIDPPPIVQLVVQDAYNETCSFLHNPYFFCLCSLMDHERDAPYQPEGDSVPAHEVLVGQLVSSLHKLKDVTNAEAGFFVFSDLSVAVSGRFRFRFSLFEYRPHHNDVVFWKAEDSAPFDVAAAKDWDGVKESTMMSRLFADQGVRLRLRKESRKRNFVPPNSASLPQTPLRPHPGGPYYPPLGSPGVPTSAGAMSAGHWPPASYATTSGYPGPYAPPPGQPGPYYGAPPPHHAYGQPSYPSSYGQQPPPPGRPYEAPRRDNYDNRSA